MKKLFAAAAIAATSLAAAPAYAGTSQAIMPVTAVVLENCTIVAGPMAFADIVLGNNGDIDSSALLTLTCSPNATFDVTMDNGLHANGSQRRMTSVLGTSYVPYEVYLDSARSNRWGATVGTDSKPGTANVLGLATLTAYGRIAAGTPVVSPGAYTDAITVSVEF